MSQQKNSKVPMLVGTALALCLIGATGWATWGKISAILSAGPPAFLMMPAAVVVSPVTKIDLVDRIEALGTAQANEETALSANVSEVVAAVQFQEGQPVHMGDVLIQLRDDEERSNLEEARKAYNRYQELSRTSAASVARRDEEKARMERAEAQVADRRIVAPFDGIAGFRKVSVGDLVTPGSPIASVYDIDPVKIEFSVPETWLSALKPDLEIRARTKAWPEDLFTGRVVAVEPKVDPVTRSVSVKAEIANPEGKLKPGLLMSVDIIRGVRSVLALSESALIPSGKNVTVYRVGKDNKAQQVPVEIGERRAGYVEILKGLSEGDPVIVEGTLKAHPDGEVKVTATRPLAELVQDSVDFAVDKKKTALQQMQRQGDVLSAAPRTEEKPQADKQQEGAAQ